MIPATYPSILDSSNRTKMLVYQVPSITGLTRWIDYIPVKSPTSESDLTLANTFANEGFILTSKVNDITGLVPFKDYVPIYLDSTATKAWSADNDGYIPMAELAGLLLDFTTGTLDERIKFSRTTNATVTNSAGQITYAPHNLLTYSEQFDNAAWTVEQGAVVANNITAPNGTLTAEKYTENALAGVHGFRNTTAIAVNNKMTASIYLKNGTRRWVAISMYDGATYSVGAVVDLTNGLITQTFGTWDSTPFTVDAGDGWYRLVVTKTLSASTFIYVCGCDSATALTTTGRQNRTGDGTSYFYIWGAQLEVGASPTTYNSTSVRNLLGFSELFDNAAWTKSNSFVQTNLLTYSEAFDNAAWTKSETSITANTTIAPNGYQTADKLVESVNNTQHLISIVSFTIGTTQTLSIYAKSAGNSRYLQFSGGGIGGANELPVFNLDNGTVDVAGTTTIVKSASITSVGNGWYRCSAVIVPTSTTLQIVLSNDASNNTAVSYFGDGASGLFIWGAQLVQGSVAGDYRRTDAAALPVYYPNHNGVVCAEKLVENTATSALHYVEQAKGAATSPYTFSVYLKAGERTWASLRSVNSASQNVRAWYNLATGVVGTVQSGAVASMQSVGNGWYRCQFTLTSANASAFEWRIEIAPSDAVSGYTGDGTSGVYIFGAQLSDSASLDPYVLNAAAAPTAAAYYGPRFDYDPVTLQPKGLLIEEQRANLLLNSTLPATNLATQSVTVTAVAHTLSFYGTGTVTITGTYIGSLVGSGAYPTRSTLTFTPTAGVILLTVTGDVQFAQLEIGAFATSFIPTAASQVTRAADVATIQGSNFYSWYNQNEGTLSLNAKTSPAGAFYLMLNSIAFTTNSTYIDLSSGSFRGVNFYNGTATAAITGGSGGTVGTDKKIAFGYKKDDFAVSVSGANAVTDTLAEVSTQIIKLEIGSAAGSGYINTTIKSISYYPQKLSNEVIKGLTA